MGEKKDIRDLYKKKKLVKIEDGNGNYAEVNIQTISHGAKTEAIERATEARAEMIRSFNDKNSKESIILNKSLSEMSKEDCIEELIALDFDLINEIETKLQEKGLTDIKSEEFAEEYDKSFAKSKANMLPQLEKKSIDELRAQIGETRKRNMLTAYYVRVFNETVLFYALIDEDGKQLFSSIKEMEENLHGNLFVELQNAYYDLDSMDIDEVKN